MDLDKHVLRKMNGFRLDASCVLLAIGWVALTCVMIVGAMKSRTRNASFFYIQGIAGPLKNADKGKSKEKRAREAREETYR